MVIGGLLFLWIAIAVIAHFHSRTDKYRIVTIFRMYKNNLKKQFSEIESINAAIKKYNSALIERGYIHFLNKFDGSEDSLKVIMLEVLIAEDVIFFGRKDTIKNKSEERWKLINEIYEKMLKS